MIRYKIYVLLFLIVLLLIPSKSIEVFYDIDLPLLNKVIFIDPGHGGRDSGTSYGNILEKNLNLKISNILYEELSKKGAIVYLTRTGDYDLSSKYDVRKKRGDLYRRIKMYKEKSANMYLSIHINWYKNSYWKGIEVLYNNINPNNKELASILMSDFKKNFNTKRTVKTTNLYMYSNTKTLGVLIECGFLSNPDERHLLQKEDYQKKLSKSITESVIKYYKKN